MTSRRACQSKVLWTFSWLSTSQQHSKGARYVRHDRTLHACPTRIINSAWYFIPVPGSRYQVCTKSEYKRVFYRGLKFHMHLDYTIYRGTHSNSTSRGGKRFSLAVLHDCINHCTNHCINHCTNYCTNHCINHCSNQPLHQPLNQPLYQPLHQPLHQPLQLRSYLIKNNVRLDGYFSPTVIDQVKLDLNVFSTGFWARFFNRIFWAR